MDGITIRVAHTQKITLPGWAKKGKGDYEHARLRVQVKRRDDGAWQVIGGPQCGTAWKTLHWAMHQAEKA
jgi:hypothetical protein